MGLFAVARNIYLAVRDDAAAMASIRAERRALAVTVATDANAGFEITSATVNGQTFGGQNSMTRSQRLQMLSQVCAMLDADAAASSRSSPVFDGASDEYSNHGDS